MMNENDDQRGAVEVDGEDIGRILSVCVCV